MQLLLLPVSGLEYPKKEHEKMILFVIILIIISIAFFAIGNLLITSNFFAFLSPHIINVLKIEGIVIAVCIPFFVYSMYRIFKKADMKGWYAFIPFYGLYKFYELSMDHGFYMFLPIFGLLLAIPFSLYNIPSNVTNSTFDANPVFAAYLALVATIYLIIPFFNLGRKFYKSIGFCFGLAFLPPVFLPILAHDKSAYGRW